MAQQHIKKQEGVVVKVKDNEVSFNHSESIDCRQLLWWLTGKGYKKLILTVRSEEEINHPEQVPHDNVINELRFKFKRHLYLFIQDPWPDPVKDFDLDDETFVIRFTYNEGCEMDRTWREWNTEDGYYLITQDEIAKL